MLNRVLEAGSVGGLARDALECSGSASVFACFERSFCLDIRGALITIGGGDLHDGPLNVRVISEAGIGLASALNIEQGQRWTTSAHRLRRHDGLEIDLGSASIWQPKTPSAAPERLKMRTGLEHLLALLAECHSEGDGLLRLVIQRSPPMTATERVARPHIEALKADLQRWLLDDTPPDPTPAIQLLGLGPGLTPSGDDLLAGLMITWHHLGAGLAADRLGRALHATAIDRTTPISQAHLAAAARGSGAAPLHDLLHAVPTASRRGLRQTLDVAAKIGHSSGLDAIAGMVLALNAWLQANGKMPVTA